jgi:hypothetical protein
MVHASTKIVLQRSPLGRVMMKRFGMVASLLMAGSLAFAAPVLAAAPTNDTHAGRTVIGSIPFSDSVDTTEATTDADDSEAWAGCGAPALTHSVWYEFVAPADGRILVDVAGSDFPAGIIVVSGSPGSFKLETCGPGMRVFSSAAGVTYAILAFDYSDLGSGGMLAIRVEAAPPPPEVHLTVDPTGSFDPRTGSATIRGTVSCLGGAGFPNIFLQLSQAVGRFTFTGQGVIGFTCDGTTLRWSINVVGDNGKFGGGKAAVVARAFACNDFGCGEDSVERTVTLKR